MSEKLEIIKRGHEAFNRGDASVPIALSTPDVEWRTTGSFPGIRGVYRGPEALRKWTETLRMEWTEFEVAIEEVLLDEGDVLVLAERLRGCGRESGAWVEMRIYTAYWFEGGKLRRREAFTEPDTALVAARRRRSAAEDRREESAEPRPAHGP
jgi:ketosteroid isomerase-like protein